MKMRSSYFLAVLAIAFSILSTSCEKDVFGCMDPNSDNFNPDANMDSGDCQYSGCTDPDSATYDPQANVDDGSCEYRGCTDPNSINYDAQATIDDGSCAYERDAFVGTYTAAETCVGAGSFNWTMTISDDPDDVSMVRVSNIGDYGFVFDATVDGDKLSFDYTDFGTGVQIVGSGTLSGNQMSFMYVATAIGTTVSDNCSGTATKQ